MRKARRHDGNRHAGVEHLGRDKVAQVMEAEMNETSGPAYADEALRHKVGQPRPGPRGVSRKYEPLLETFSSMLGRETVVLGPQKFEARMVERHPVRAPGLGGHKDRTIRTLDDRALDRPASAHQVDVHPAQGDELPSSGAGGGGECQIEMERRVVRHGLEKSGHLARCRWSHLDGLVPGRAGVIGHVVEDP